MKTYVILFRGINVGGKNKIPMAELKNQLEKHGFSAVKTYINSGNVILKSDLSATATGAAIEAMLPKRFKLDSAIIKVVAIDQAYYRKVISQAPKEFGQDNERYRYYVLFLMGVTSATAMQDIEARPDIDTVWAGTTAIYFRFPAVGQPDATKSYLNKLIGKPVYQQISMRNWNTTLKLQDLLEN